MDFNLPEELQRRICFALIPAKSLYWPPKLSHYLSADSVDTFPVRRYSSRQRNEGIRIFLQRWALQHPHGQTDCRNNQSRIIYHRRCICCA